MKGHKNINFCKKRKLKKMRRGALYLSNPGGSSNQKVDVWQWLNQSKDVFNCFLNKFFIVDSTQLKFWDFFPRDYLVIESFSLFLTNDSRRDRTNIETFFLPEIKKNKLKHFFNYFYYLKASYNREGVGTSTIRTSKWSF